MATAGRERRVLTSQTGARIMAGMIACLIAAGLVVAVKTGKMVNPGSFWALFSPQDRPRYFWYTIALGVGLSAFCAYLAIFAPL